MQYANLHTHTTFSDGKDTPEEQAEAALARHFVSLGFSDHSYTPFDTSYCMKKDVLPLYRQAILSLREAYAGKLDILLGYELDYFSEMPTDPFDYIIGSVHFIRTADGLYHPVDEGPAIQKQTADDYFGGDMVAMASAYFSTVVAMAQRFRTLPLIIGHYDLVTKYSMMPEDDPAYRRIVLEAAEAILPIHQIFEINTGAIARGYRHLPYPAAFCIRYLAAHGAQFVLNSDCHKAALLDCYFPESIEILRQAGVGHILQLTSAGFREVKI